MSNPALKARLVRAELLQVVDLGNGVKLCAHPLSGGRVYVNAEIAEIIESFRIPQVLGEWAAEQMLVHGNEHGQRALSCALGLLSEGILFDTSHGDETGYWAALFAANVVQPTESERARPGRRARKFEVSVPRSLEAFGSRKQRVSMLFFGACSAQLLVDFVREIANGAMIDVNARATIFPDVELAGEFKPDVIVAGQFPEKVSILEFPAWGQSQPPVDVYTQAARTFLAALRQHSAAPVLLLNLPTPTCSPLGMADRGAHLNQVRRINIALAALTSEIDNVHIVDVDQALGLEGRRGLVDDALAGFGHLGSLPWLVHQYRHPHPGLEAYSEDLGPVPEALAHGEFETERIISSQIVSMLLALLGIGRRKCVVVDLDNTLWPGVLADNGEPFPCQPQFDIYPYGRYWGLHSALKALRARGIILACVSKNDEEVVRRLWRYNGVPGQLFLSIDDFVTVRINWREKVENIESIARELNLGLEAFAFIEDHPVERAKVKQYLPQVMVFGDDPYMTRWDLLTSHVFQVPAVTEEAARRNEMTRGQIERDRALASAHDPALFLATLELQCTIDRVRSTERLPRIQELIDRTHQLNTTGRKWDAPALSALITGKGDVYTLSARDRFVDYGLVGVCVMEAGTIEILVVSCRVLGLGIEQAFLSGILNSLREGRTFVEALYIPTERNLPARGLYAAQGFTPSGDNRWHLQLTGYSPSIQPHIHSTIQL